MDSERTLAIQVKGAYKTYDRRKYVLRGLDMNVPKGSIYGLLGSSGCGKSTLLNAIVNLVGLESGDISTIMKTKRDLGFMPQQLALYDRMTTEETLKYFGNIYQMGDDEIEERTKYLVDFLEIPNDGREFSHMSGGQKRRLSLAAALIHNPTIVVLDEPTVGVDPILRKSIWDYLINLAESEKKTIVITTHYIEETRQAHMIGLMRSGVLLCEDTPDNLLAQNNSGSLEETFMRLSHLQECHRVKDDEEDANIRKKLIKKTTPPEFSKNAEMFNWRRFKAEMMKNFMFMKRDYGVLLYTLVIPLLTLVNFHYGIGITPSPLRLAVFNEESAYNMLNCQNWTLNGTCGWTNLGCRVISGLGDRDIEPVLVNSMSEGIDLIHKADVWGIMRIPHNYSQSIEQLTESSGFQDDRDKDLLLAYGLIDIQMDQSNYITYQAIHEALTKSVIDVLGQVLEECGYSHRASHRPIRYEKPIYYSEGSDTRSYMAPPFIAVTLFTIPMAYGVVIILEEKLSGATARSVASGLTPFELLAGHFCIQILIHTVQTFLQATLLFGIMKYEFMNPPVAIALLYSIGLPGILFSFLIPLWLDSLLAAGSVCSGFVLGTTLMGGTVWPVEAVHPLLKPISWSLPTYFSVAALRNTNFKGWGWTEPSVIFGFSTIVIWSVVLIATIKLTIVISKNRVFLGKGAN